MMATIQQNIQSYSDNNTLMILQDLFQKTLHPSQEQRDQAEEQLLQFINQSGILNGLMFCLYLLSLTTTPYSVSQSCSIFIKNQLKHYYDTHSDTHSMISLLQPFRQSLLDFYIYSCSQSLKKHVYPSFIIIIDEHYLETWPDLLSLIHKNLSLQSPDSHSLLGLLDILLVIVQVFNSSSKKQPKFIFTDIYSILLELFPRSSFHIKKSILKVYYKSIQFLLSKELFDISSWMECIVTTILANSHEDLMFYKMKKWAFHCLDRLFCRYGISSNQYLEFSKQFKKVFATPTAKLALEQIFSLKQMHDNCQDESILHVLDRITSCCADIITESIGTKSLWSAIEPQYQHLVSQVIFPRLCYSQIDDDDPLFIYRQLDITELADDYSSNHSLLSIYLEMIKKKKSIVLDPILSFIQSVLTSTTAKPEQKDGALVMLGHASDSALKILQKNESLENWISIMIQYIRECTSYPFLRARALWVFEQFGSNVTYSSIEHVHRALDTVVNAFISDSSPSVRIQAANTLNMMLVYEEVRPLLPLTSIVQVLLDLINQYSSADCLVDVLENLIKTFSEEMIPFTSQLMEQLSFSLMKALGSIEQSSKENAENDGNEYDGLFFTAMGLFKTMDTLVIGLKKDDKGILNGIESLILEPIVFVLQHKELEDFHEEILELLDAMMFIQRKISPFLWKIFPMIYAECVQLSFCDMIPVLDNYISFGDKNIVFGQEAMQIWLTMICKVITASECNDECFYGEADRIGACQIIEALMLHGRGLLSNRELELFLSWATKLLFDDGNSDEEIYRSNAAIVYYLEVILNVLIYDSKCCMEWLKNHNLLHSFLTTMDKDKVHFVRVHDKRLLMMASYQVLLLCIQGILDKNVAEIASNTMMECLQYATSTFSKAVEERNKLMEQESDQDEYEYETEDESTEPSEVNYVDEDDDLYQDSFSFDEDEDDNTLEEELYFETPLDNIDIYSLLQRDVFNNANKSFFIQHPHYAFIQQILVQGMPKPVQ